MKIKAKLSDETKKLLKGEKGDRGNKFLGTFSKIEDLPDPNSYQQGDFVVVDGTIWYIL